MKSAQSVVFRALSFLLVGILMVVFPDKMTEWLVVIIGILFFVPGLVSIVSFFRAYSKEDSTRMLLPVIGVGSIVLGAILIAMPTAFIKWMMYVLALLLLLAGITSLTNMMRFRKYTTVGAGFYVLPVLLCMAGVFIVINPLEAASLPFIIFGVSSILYALFELVGAIHFRKVYRQMAAAQFPETVKEEEAVGVVEVVEDTPEQTQPSDDEDTLE